MGTWLDNGLKEISSIEEEHSSSLYALLKTTLDKPQSWILAHPEYLLDPKEEASLNSFLSRLLSAEPLAYIIGKQSFYGLEFLVCPDVLIPRPETELLVEEAIKKAHSLHDHILIADVGTGSGCIATSLARALPKSVVIATDASYETLQVAKRNIQNHHVDNRVYLIQTYLLDGIVNNFNLICANLPYIPSNTLKDPPILKYEPRLALDGGVDGFTFITHLLKDLKDKIQPDGTVFLEIEHTQKQRTLDLCRSLFPNATCMILDDLAGLPRVAIINFME
ncbi:MAG: peptide chain release factor N(5)-glutamine methyltransferase [Pelolinea sp.]|nr:peptide chain release factor N(5)-glutamine methyltransferase [Pelolinea sp.]